MSECTTNPVKRRITRRSQMLASACLLIYLGTSQLATRTTGPFSMALAVIAGLSIFGEVFFVGNMVLTLRDEFQQILLTRSFVWATVITMGIVTVWGFVELHGRDSVPHLPVVMVPVMLLILTAFAKLIIFRQHKSPTE
jgi:hypothetical protein